MPGFHTDSSNSLTYKGAALAGRSPHTAQLLTPLGEAQGGSAQQQQQQASLNFPDFRQLPLPEQLRLVSWLRLGVQSGAVDYGGLPGCPAWLRSEGSAGSEHQPGLQQSSLGAQVAVGGLGQQGWSAPLLSQQQGLQLGTGALPQMQGEADPRAVQAFLQQVLAARSGAAPARGGL